MRTIADMQIYVNPFKKKNIPVDRWQIGGWDSLSARRAETFAGPSSPGPAKIHLLGVLCGGFH